MIEQVVLTYSEVSRKEWILTGSRSSRSEWENLAMTDSIDNVWLWHEERENDIDILVRMGERSSSWKFSSSYSSSSGLPYWDFLFHRGIDTWSLTWCTILPAILLDVQVHCSTMLLLRASSISLSFQPLKTYSTRPNTNCPPLISYVQLNSTILVVVGYKWRNQRYSNSVMIANLFLLRRW